MDAVPVTVRDGRDLDKFNVFVSLSNSGFKLDFFFFFFFLLFFVTGKGSTGVGNSSSLNRFLVIEVLVGSVKEIS